MVGVTVVTGVTGPTGMSELLSAKVLSGRTKEVDNLAAKGDTLLIATCCRQLEACRASSRACDTHW